MAHDSGIKGFKLKFWNGNIAYKGNCHQSPKSVGYSKTNYNLEFKHNFQPLFI